MNSYRHKKPYGVTIVTYKHQATGKKRYTPMIQGKELRLSWNTKTRAEIYGAMILNRYVKKLAILAKQN